MYLIKGIMEANNNGRSSSVMAKYNEDHVANSNGEIWRKQWRAMSANNRSVMKQWRSVDNKAS
jgi:hypothetical protein